MKIDYRGSSKILKRLAELVNRSQNIALRQDATDKNVLYWTDLDGVEITINIPSGSVEVDAELSETSTNPAENQAITKELAKKADKSDIPAVGDGTLSVQRNGKSVGTFSANAAKNTAINIPVPEKVSELENDAGYGTYTKPTTGIPKSDLASGVQASLDKADTALQKHQDISGKLDKTGDASNTTVAFSAASARENVKTGEKLSVIAGKIAKWFADLKTVAFTGSYNDLSNKPTIPDISGKQDKSTAVTHTANTAVGSTTKPVYVTADGKAAAISHSINSDVPANAKFTDTVYTHPTTSGNTHIPSGGSSGQILRWSADGTAVWGADNNTTYNDATQSAHGLMSAADKKKLDGIADGANKIIVDSALSDTSTNPVQSKAVKTALDGKAASGHTHAMITNSALLIAGASNAVKWVRLGTIVSGGDARSAIIRVWSGNGYNAGPSQNASFEIQIKDGWQSTQSATKACGVTVYRINCGTVKVKVIPTAHDTYTVWVYLPWTYWNGNYAVYGRYKTWTPQLTNQTDEPDGTAADIAYYDHAFITSTVAKATEATALTETAWTAVPATGADSTSERDLKYLVMGNTVYVQGYLKFSAGNNNPKCGTLPGGARPNDTLYFTSWDTQSGVPTAFPIVVNEAGIIMLMNPTSTAYWFKAGRAYRFNFSYHIN